jgi:DNA-binding winged helix-turn-helix (wHTH) protein/tetratricopeptide (TPR) repeat protein
MGRKMPNGGPNYRFADFILDVREHRVSGPGQDVYLPPKTFETLLYLVKRDGHLVTKKELLDAVWPDTAVTENALTRCIKEAREVLRDDVHNPLFIETIPRVGYKFIAAVEPVLPAGQDPGFREEPTDAEPAVAASSDRIPIPGWWKRHAIPAAVGLAGLLALAGASYLALRRSPALAFTPRSFILISDIDNQTGDPLFDRTLTTAFTVSLEQSTYANVFPRSRAAGTLRLMGKAAVQKIDEELGREICQRENIRGLVAMSIVNVGRQYALSARIIDPQNGSTVRSDMEYAQDRDHILPALRSLAAEVRRALGESLSSIRASNRDLPQVTTASLRALKFYSDGTALWDKGQYQDAVRLYRSAIEEDQEFAMAHAALGSACFSHIYSDTVNGKAHFDKALQLSARTTDRERRSIQLRYEDNLGHFQAAYDLYQVYLQTYPDDFRIRYDFGTFLKNNNRYEEAVGQFREVNRVAPSYTNAYINTASCYSLTGKPSDALGYYSKAFNLEPALLKISNLNHEYGFTMVKAGEAAKARELFTQALSTEIKPQALRSLALLAMYEGRYHEAKGRLDEVIQLDTSPKELLRVSRNHLFMSIVMEGMGRRAELVAELNRAARGLEVPAPPVWLGVRLGVAYARAGATPQAARLLNIVREHTDLKSAQDSSELHRLEGELELARGNSRRALDLLLTADNEYRGPFTAESLARAYRVTGDNIRAIGSYELLLGMKDASLGFEPQQNWISAHYWLARLYASQAEKLKAKKLAEALLGMWKGADSDLPLLRNTVRLTRELADLAPM